VLVGLLITILLKVLFASTILDQPSSEFYKFLFAHIYLYCISTSVSAV